MKRFLPLCLLFGILTKTGYSQLYIEPALGYQYDLNNSNWHYANTQVQVSYKISRFYEMLLKVQKSWTLGQNHFTDSSFSLASSLPYYAAAHKTITPSILSVSYGNRFKVAGIRSNKSLFLAIYAGISFQENKVQYQYDETNYTLLNPDKSTQRTGPFICAGLGYMRSFEKSRLFIELNLASPPIADKISYPNSFHLSVPIGIHFIYSYKLSK